MASKYIVRLRKVYRDQITGQYTGTLPVKVFETMAESSAKAENNARFRFGPEGQIRNWRSVGWGEQMRVELVECREIA